MLITPQSSHPKFWPHRCVWRGGPAQLRSPEGKPVALIHAGAEGQVTGIDTDGYRVVFDGLDQVFIVPPEARQHLLVYPLPAQERPTISLEWLQTPSTVGEFATVLKANPMAMPALMQQLQAALSS